MAEEDSALSEKLEELEFASEDAILAWLIDSGYSHYYACTLIDTWRSLNYIHARPIVGGFVYFVALPDPKWAT